MSEYASIPATGKLKLKGTKDGRVDKKKKKKKSSHATIATIADTSAGNDGSEDNEDFQDRSVVLNSLADEDVKIQKDDRRAMGVVDGKDVLPGAGEGDDDLREHLKTEAERRHDEQRRKRLEERLKKEGVKTHKQRVEELNKYLSSLSEHHDMPKIGPG